MVVTFVASLEMRHLKMAANKDIVKVEEGLHVVGKHQLRTGQESCCYYNTLAASRYRTNMLLSDDMTSLINCDITPVWLALRRRRRRYHYIKYTYGARYIAAAMVLRYWFGAATLACYVAALYEII